MHRLVVLLLLAPALVLVARLAAACESGPDWDAPVTQLSDDFEQDFESNWLTESKGGSRFHLTTRQARSGTRSVYAGDETTGEYRNDTDTVLEFRRPLQLSATGQTTFSWMMMGKLDCGSGSGFGIDYVTVEVLERGASGGWQRALSTCSSSAAWKQHDVKLTKYAGKTIRIRIRFKETGWYNFEGPYIDDVRLETASP